MTEKYMLVEQQDILDSYFHQLCKQSEETALSVHNFKLLLYWEFLSTFNAIVVL